MKTLCRSFRAGSIVLMVCFAAGAAQPDEPIVPEKVIKLLNGRDFSGLYTWLKDSRHQDPRKVFTLQDGMLHISGNGLGYIGTRNEYADYHLVLEFKWGERTWGVRKHRTRDSGVLLHAVGPDGNFKDGQYDSQFARSIDGGKSGGEYMTSIEAQIIEGGVGDIIVIQGKDAEGASIPVSLTAEIGSDGFWREDGEKKTFSTTSRIQWFDHDRQWKDVTGFRGKRDVESPCGQWTRMDVICDGAHVAVHVNGVLVNEGFAVSPSAGKILIQCELSEVYIRRWELWPLEKGPAPKPGNSGQTTDRLGSITKQGSAMARFVLGQMVLHVLRRDARMKAWYGRIKRCRGSKIARVAVMRRLATIL